MGTDMRATWMRGWFVIGRAPIDDVARALSEGRPDLAKQLRAIGSGARSTPVPCRAFVASLAKLRPLLVPSVDLAAGVAMSTIYPTREPFIANTDRAWFDFLASKAIDGRVDEVNFWLPKATTPMKAMTPGEVIFFRLKRPDYKIAGYGFFAHFTLVDLDTAWSAFGWKNGDPNKRRFFERIGEYRGVDLLAPQASRAPIGCTVLRDATFWPPARWLPWGEGRGWASNIVQGKTERDVDRVSVLLSTLRADARALPDDLAERFVPLDADQRLLVVREIVDREGQGAFRLRLLSAYDGQCAITGEHTEPVLDAAHIQPYLGARSNHVQNGMLMTKEFHALFDAGYVGVTPDYEVKVSERLRADWRNGRRYYPYDGQRLVHLPDDHRQRPSRDALAWHLERVFKKAG